MVSAARRSTKVGGGAHKLAAAARAARPAHGSSQRYDVLVTLFSSPQLLRSGGRSGLPRRLVFHRECAISVFSTAELAMRRRWNRKPKGICPKQVERYFGQIYLLILVSDPFYWTQHL